MTPPTVIALLTILGYSLYDTVVVFDRVEENLEYLGQPGRRTFAQVVNTSQNEVLWRSINTSLTSLFVAGPLLAAWRGREPEMARLHERYGHADEEIVAPAPEAAAASRRPVTTEYVRGEGKRKRRRR